MKFLHASFRAATLAALGLASLAVNAQTFDDHWQFSAGAAAATVPRYPGADRQRTLAFPTARASYGRFTLGSIEQSGIPFGAAAVLAKGNGWSVGTAVGSQFTKQRKESDSARLTGLGDIDTAVLGSLFATYDDSWFSVRGNVVTDLDRGHDSQGTRASLDAFAKYKPLPTLMLSAGPGVVWSDRRHQQTFFGVDADQSARSGLPGFAAGAGLEAVRLTFGADYRLSQQWTIGARLVTSELRGDAARSPVTEKRHQSTGLLLADYRF